MCWFDYIEENNLDWYGNKIFNEEEQIIKHAGKDYGLHRNK
jgi:hypothetical protein